MAIILTKDQDCDQRVQTIHTVTGPTVFTFSGSATLHASVIFNGANVAQLGIGNPVYEPPAVGDYTIIIVGTCGTANIHADDSVIVGSTPMVQSCMTFRGFDYLSIEDLDGGESQTFEILVDDNVEATVVENYDANSTGGVKSSWYVHLVAAVNALPHWSMNVNTDANDQTRDKPTWNLQYNGPGNEKLEIRGVEGGESRYFDVDASGNITPTVNNAGTIMSDFETPQFNQVACNEGTPVGVPNV